MTPNIPLRDGTLFVSVAIACGTLLMASSAQQATSNIKVTAEVKGSCTITTVDVDFGPYDPVVTNRTAPKDATGSVTVTCTQGTPGATIGIGTGSNAPGRRMAGAGSFMVYELYSNPGRTTVWGTLATNDVDVPVPASSTTPQTFTIYGRIPQAQDVPVGNYSDVALATVNF